jgi:hypothetical protein
MAFLFSQIFEAESDGKALWTRVHDAGILPNIMDHLTHTHLREVLFVN